MSNALAIASVTAVLKDLLNNAAIDSDFDADVKVSTEPPDLIPKEPRVNQLNLFLYRVASNSGLRNAAFPSHNSTGQRITNPPLALDLYYLLTAYGASDFDAEIMLGYAMLMLHDNPILSLAAIRQSLGGSPPVAGTNLPGAHKTLSASDLAEQVEKLTITPMYLDTEEMSRIWSSFQTPYRISTGYKVTVVLMQNQKVTRPTLPVLSFNLYSNPINLPFIAEIRPQRATVGDQVTIFGRNLDSPTRQLTLNGTPIDPATIAASNDQLRFPVPATASAGINTVQVEHLRELGTPPVPHGGVPSNPIVLQVLPSIEAITVDNKTDNGRTDDAKRVSAELELTLKPAVGGGQSVVLLLNEFNGSNSYAFPTPQRPSAPAEGDEKLTIAVTDIIPGAYLIRIQVDGLLSELELAGGVFDEPKETIDTP